MANHENNLTVTPGTPKFDHLVFRLNHRLTDDNLQLFDYRGNHFQRIQKGVFVMPIYLSKKFNLFMVAAKLVEDDWILAFAKAKIRPEKHREVTSLLDPMPTGKGLNLLGRRAPDHANQLLKYFTTLTETKHGEWRLVK